MTGHRVVSVLPEAEQIALLDRTSSRSVRAIFGAEIHPDPQGQWGRYVRTGEGARSLGTICAGRLYALRYQHYPERASLGLPSPLLRRER